MIRLLLIVCSATIALFALPSVGAAGSLAARVEKAWRSPTPTRRPGRAAPPIEQQSWLRMAWHHPGPRFVRPAHRPSGILTFVLHRGGAEESTFENYQRNMTRAQALRDDVLLVNEGDIRLHRGQLVLWHGVDLPGGGVSEPEVHQLFPLERALAELEGAPFLFDLKTTEAVEPALAMIAQYGASDRIKLAAQEHAPIYRARLLGYPGDTALSYYVEAAPITLIPPLIRLLPLTGEYVSLPAQHFGLEIATPGRVRTWHQQGLAAHIFDVKDARGIERLVKAGVDYIEVTSWEPLRAYLGLPRD